MEGISQTLFAQALILHPPFSPSGGVCAAGGAHIMSSNASASVLDVDSPPLPLYLIGCKCQWAPSRCASHQSASANALALLVCLHHAAKIARVAPIPPLS